MKDKIPIVPIFKKNCCFDFWFYVQKHCIFNSKLFKIRLFFTFIKLVLHDYISTKINFIKKFCFY